MQTQIVFALALAVAAVVLAFLIARPASKKKSAATAALGFLGLVLAVGAFSLKDGGIISNATLEFVFAATTPPSVVLLDYGAITAFLSIWLDWGFSRNRLIDSSPSGFLRQLIWPECWVEDWRARRTRDG